jgi:hypothetical protein
VTSYSAASVASDSESEALAAQPDRGSEHGHWQAQAGCRCGRPRRFTQAGKLTLAFRLEVAGHGASHGAA